MSISWYQELFENYAETYDQQVFTQGTSGEVDFIEQEIQGHKSLSILDIGCGTGRHAVELARRGYSVVGIDLSSAQLARARQKAQQLQVAVEFKQLDARTLTFDAQFDLVLMICEAAFPLMETDDMNFQILKQASQALKTPGKLILTTLNALYPLFHHQELLNTLPSESGHFDMLTFRETSIVDIVDDSGVKKSLSCQERYYAPSEINWYLKSLQFNTIDIYGCQLGQFSRQHPLTQDDFEMLVIAEKL